MSSNIELFEDKLFGMLTRTMCLRMPLTNSSLVSVSHTTDDLVFEWDPIMPLDVDSGIELPQLELTNNFTGDCTTAYSTGDTRIRREREGIFCEKLGVNFIEWRGF